MRHVVVGMGEVGSALLSILRDAYKEEVLGIDVLPAPVLDAVFLHICFPYSKSFLSEVEKYQREYKPRYTVIHSTVPVGTSAVLGAVHSPVRGQHWDMKLSLRTFVKFVGGPEDKVSVVANELLRAGIPVHIVRSSEATELAKILCTTLYGVLVQFAKDVDTYCQSTRINTSDILTLWTKTYNDGYERLGHPEYTRPIIEPIQLPIGGHCVTPNAGFVPAELGKWANIVKGD